jgi:peptidoglycan/LPS O-acetylase OafA/YrhL
MLHHHGQFYDVLFPGQRVPPPVDPGAGHFGVELFFIISGFVIFMTIERKETVREFAVSRLTRLMPTFVVAMLLATALLLLWPMPPLQSPTLRQFLANLTMAPTFFGELEIDMPYWTLTYELVFYVFMAVVMALGLLRSTEWIGLAGIAISCVFIATLDVRLHHRSAIVLLVYYSSFFLIGICLYHIHQRTARPITYVVLAVAIAATAMGGGERSFHTPGSIYLPLTMALTLFVWFAGEHGHLIAWRPLIFLGRISYPLYLVHVAVGFQIIRLGVERGWSTVTGIALATVVCLAVATLLHYAVELPGQRWGRALAKRHAIVPPGPAAQTGQAWSTAPVARPNPTPASTGHIPPG